MPPTYHVKAGLNGRIVITLTFKGNLTFFANWIFDHLNHPIARSCSHSWGFLFRNRFKRLRDPFQEIPVYKVSIPSLQISIFVCRCVRNTTRRTRRMWTTNMLCKLSQVLTINCQTWHHGQSFFQATERSIFMKMMERGQVFVWLFPLLILM